MFPILNPPPTSLLIPSLWDIPVHQPWAFCIIHQTWTGDSFHIRYYTYFSAILPNHPTFALSHRVQKTVLYICVTCCLAYRVIVGNGTQLQYSCLENPMDGGAWWAAVHGVTKSGTWLNDFTFTFHFHALEKEMATITLYARQQVTQMYRTVFWTLWERAKVGWFGRMALKYV